MEYWANIFGMAGAACIAITFIEGHMLPLFWGLILAYVGFKMWRVK